jgi:hypothetical protein
VQHLTLLVAIATAAALAIVGRPFVHYQCWYSWGKFNGILGAVLYLLIGGVGGGVAGWVIGQIAHANPTQNPAVNGFLFGAAGALALRADFSSRPKRESAKSATANVDHAISILGISIHWTTEMSDALTRRKVESWLSSISSAKELNGIAVRIAARIVDLDIPAATKTTMGTNLANAMEKVNSEAEGDQIEGRARVEQFCTNFIVTHHIPKPALPALTGTP